MYTINLQIGHIFLIDKIQVSNPNDNIDSILHLWSVEAMIHFSILFYKYF